MTLSKPSRYHPYLAAKIAPAVHRFRIHAESVHRRSDLGLEGRRARADSKAPPCRRTGRGAMKPEGLGTELASRDKSVDRRGTTSVSDADSVVPGAVVVLNHEAPHSSAWPSATQETQRRRRC